MEAAPDSIINSAEFLAVESLSGGAQFHLYDPAELASTCPG
jgi:hypothetical protein